MSYFERKTAINKWYAMAAISGEEESAVKEDKKDDQLSISIHDFQKFETQLETLNPWGLCVVITGTRSSGKTHLLKYLLSLLRQLREIDAVFLISSTAGEQFDNTAYDYIPPQFMYKSLTKLNDILNKQRDVVKHNKNLEKFLLDVKDTNMTRSPKFIESKVTVIIDDFYGQNVRGTSAITEVCTHGRHLSYVHPKTKRPLVRTDVYFLSQDLTQLVSFFMFLPAPC